jgi:hypothetical protein
VRGGRLDVVDAKRKVIEAQFSQIRRVRPGIGSRERFELKQLDLEMRLRPLEYEGYVLRLHARHTHVQGGNAAVDRCDVIFSKTEEREEFNRRAGICHCDRNVIRIEYHLIIPAIKAARSITPDRVPTDTVVPVLEGYHLVPANDRRNDSR